LLVGEDNFYFLLSLVNFHKILASGQKIKFLIPHLTYFHCPDATLAGNGFRGKGGRDAGSWCSLLQLETLRESSLNEGGSCDWEPDERCKTAHVLGVHGSALLCSIVLKNSGRQGSSSFVCPVPFEQH